MLSLRHALRFRELRRNTPRLSTRYSSSSSSSSASSASSSSNVLPVPRPDYRLCLSSADSSSTRSLAAINLENRRAPIPCAADELVARIQELHQEVVEKTHNVNILRRTRNEIGTVLADKKTDTQAKEDAKKRAGELKESLVLAEKDLEEKEGILLQSTLLLPNDTHPESPIGGYEQCKTVKLSSGLQNENETEAIKPNPKADHIQLLSALGWIAFPTNVTGSSWPYLLKGGAALEIALTQYALQHAVQAGFAVVMPPDVVRHELMKRCGFNPRDSGGEAQTYFVSTSEQGESGEDTLALAATAEIPLAGLFINTLFRSPKTELPRKVVGIGHAFRAEAGARGKESRGLYRVHQFTKVELFMVTQAEESGDALKELVDLQWKILDGLGLPLRLLNMSSEELGASAYQKYDIESYMPGRGSWGELASASNCTDYQSRRLDIRYSSNPPSSSSTTTAEASGSAKTVCAHTLNATAAAVPRLIVAIVESGAKFDEHGNWVVLELPKVLRRYWIGKEADMDEWDVRLPKEKGKNPKGAQNVTIRWA